MQSPGAIADGSYWLDTAISPWTREYDGSAWVKKDVSGRNHIVLTGGSKEHLV